MKWIALVALLLTTLGSSVGAHAQTSRAVLEDSRLAPVRPRLARAVETARREGLPSDWLLDKIAEGLSKRVPPARIAAAVDAMLERIRAAFAIVRDVPGARGAERTRVLRAAVDALATGAPRAQLGLLVREVAASDRAHAVQRVHEVLTTVAELGERDFGGPVALEATAGAFRRGRRAGLEDLLRRARQIGRDPPGGRDAALRRVGGAPESVQGIDRRGPRGEHGRDVQSRPGGR